MNQLDQFERTYCDCRKCQSACDNMPGMLAPGEIDRIARNAGVDMEDPYESEEFIRGNFQASDGAVVVRHGKMAVIPTIVPAQQENGHCVFLKEGRCTVHESAPFGCRMFNVCDGPETARDANLRVSACLVEICQSRDYLLTWEWLKLQGSIARPLRERRAALQEAIGE